MINLRDVQNALRRAALTVNDASFLLDEVVDRLMDALTFIQFKPKRLLQLGSISTTLTKSLYQYYPEANIVVLDYIEDLFNVTQTQSIVGSYAALPFSDHSFDMIVSASSLNWVNDLSVCFRECQRLLTQNGLLFFSMFGVETLKELKESFIVCKDYFHLFPDMHDVGDLLLQTGFENPVMNMETLTVRYKKLETLFHDLKKTGMGNIHQDKSRGLFGKQRWQKAVSHYDTLKSEDAYPASIEIIYGHAWQPVKTANSTINEVGVSIESLKNNR